MKTHFYALKEDLICMIDSIGKNESLKFYPRNGNGTESMDCSAICCLPELGTADADSAIGCKSYLVFKKNNDVNLRYSENGKFILIDQLENPNSVVFSPGGQYNEDIILYGYVGTCSASSESLQLMKLFKAAMKCCGFKKVKSFHVGHKAYLMLAQGRKLTVSIHSSIVLKED